MIFNNPLFTYSSPLKDPLSCSEPRNLFLALLTLFAFIYMYINDALKNRDNLVAFGYCHQLIECLYAAAR